MKKLIIKTATIFLLLLIWNNASFAQANPDSIRMVQEALQMIQFPEPVFNGPNVANLSPKAIADIGFEQPYQSEAIKIEMRDGIQIHGQKYSYSTQRTVLFLHGALGSSYTNNKVSGLLRENLQAEVIAIDLRGHGQSEGSPGDIATSNQYAEDLEDLIGAIKKDRPSQKIILAGHSMGGGIILRHAETFGPSQVDGYLLFAPNFGTNAPTSSQDFDIQNNFLKIHLSRGMGLYMLNYLGIHEYDSLKVVFYNLPEQMPLRSYTYRSMQASFPMDYRKSLRAIDKPLLVLIGSKDEAFIAELYAPIIKSYSKGDFYLIQGETHSGIRHNEEAMKKVQEWAITNKLR